MVRLQDSATNVDNPIDGGVWVFDAFTDTWKNMVVIGVNLEGIADGSVLTVGGGGTLIEYLAATPLLLSDNATAIGRTLIGDGTDIVDEETMVILLRDDDPLINEGFEGAYWVNRTTKVMFGPRGQDGDGEWPLDTKSFLSTLDGVSAIDGDLVIKGLELKHQAWSTAFKFTNFAINQGDLSDETNGFIGLEMIIGSEALGFVGLRPYGSDTVQGKHLRIGGHGTGGEFQDFSGSPYITKDALDTDRAALALFIGKNSPGVAITAGTTDDYEIDQDGGTQRIVGGITATATTIVIGTGEAGEYDIAFDVTIHNPDASNPAQFSSHLRLNGVNLTVAGAQEFVKIPPDSTYTSRVWAKRLVCADADAISVQYDLVDSAGLSGSAGSWGTDYGGCVVDRRS